MIEFGISGFWFKCRWRQVTIPLLWRGPMAERGRLQSAAAILLMILGGFFAAALFVGSYGGGFTDVEAPTLLGLDGNLFAFSIEAALVVAALALGLRRAEE